MGKGLLLASDGIGDAEFAQAVDKVVCDGDLELAGLELDIVPGLRVVEVHAQLGFALVVLEELYQAPAELFAQLRGGEIDGEALEHRLCDIAEHAYLLDPESVGRSLALGPFLRFEEILLLDVSLDEDL